jgi:hypothetical protein
MPGQLSLMVTFMELLVMPGFGLEEGRYTFFAKPEQSMQILAVADIGKYVAAIFADQDRFGGQTFDIASDTVTGEDLQIQFSQAAGYPIAFARFPQEVLDANPFLQS